MKAYVAIFEDALTEEVFEGVGLIIDEPTNKHTYGSREFFWCKVNLSGNTVHRWIDGKYIPKQIKKEVRYDNHRN
jgi:hypothetical protein